ncbi:hypothetical protein JOC75_000167 [Metabacillus crassostreae]|nr:hypothetical protein [Metabacillus crassostreae]MBM7602197.1 hypothetical protein [Metabacillus crassostreae]
MNNNKSMNTTNNQELIELVKEALNSDVNKEEFKQYIELKKLEMKKHMN